MKAADQTVAHDVVQLSARELTLLERNDLQYHEQRIQRGMDSFLDFADALIKIRDGKLYREKYDTFERYCRERWDFTDRRAQQLMAASEAVAMLPEETRTIVRHEGIAREVARVTPAKREEVVREAAARAEAEDRKPTARDVKEVSAEKTFTIDKPARSKPYSMPSRGLFIARGAIEQLKTILATDGERAEALRLVRDWCEEQILANNHVNPPPTPNGQVNEALRKSAFLKGLRAAWNLATKRDRAGFGLWLRFARPRDLAYFADPGASDEAGGKEAP
jgi:hypothetical protein